MPKAHHPRRGSLQFWPRKRARRHYPKINSWAKTSTVKPLAFIGYKAGMTHAMLIDNKEHSPTQGQDIFTPITVIECPPIKPLSLRFYKKTHSGYQSITQIFSKNISKELARKVKLSKKTKEEKIPEDFDDLKLVIYTQPHLTNIGKKKPEIIEVALGGNKEEQLEFGKKLLEKDSVRINEIFEEGQFIDVHAVTKGKGFQGPVKRFGVKLKSHKSEKKKRASGNLGAWTPAKVSWTVPQAGKMGYHNRVEYNKLLIKIGDNPKDIVLKGGFLHYGIIKNDYILLKGSILGSQKRPVILTEPIRQKQKQSQIQISYLSLSSKQG